MPWGCGAFKPKVILSKGKFHVLKDTSKCGTDYDESYKGSWVPFIKPWHAIMDKKEKQPEPQYESYWDINGVMKMREV